MKSIEIMIVITLKRQLFFTRFILLLNPIRNAKKVPCRLIYLEVAFFHVIVIEKS